MLKSVDKKKLSIEYNTLRNQKSIIESLVTALQDLNNEFSEYAC